VVQSSEESPEPTDTYTPEPTDTYTPEPTNTYTPEPTNTYTPEPTDTDTPIPTDTPTPIPTELGLPGKTIQVTVLDDQGTGLEGAHVELYRMGSPIREGTTNSIGWLVWEISPVMVTYRLVEEDPVGYTSVSASLPAGVDGTVIDPNTIEFTLPEEESVLGLFTFTDEEAPTATPTFSPSPTDTLTPTATDTATQTPTVTPTPEPTEFALPGEQRLMVPLVYKMED
jgi:hypothetical protein